MKKRRISDKMRRTKCWRKHVNLQDELTVIEAKLKKRYEKDRDRKEKKAIRSIAIDPNYFYNYAKKFSRESKVIGPLLKDGVAVSSDKDMAEILIDQYSSVLREPREEVNNDFIEDLVKKEESGKVMDTINVNPVVVREAIAELRNGSAAGSDGVSAVLLKNGGDVIVAQIEKLLQKSVDCGNFPEELKDP